MTTGRECAWAKRSLEEQVYHDTEWGVPTHEDSVLFEFLVLETMQAGLSWTLVLKRREAMREAFDGFDINKVAAYTPDKESQLLENPNIIRNRLKIASLRKNALAFKKIQNGESLVGHWQTEADVPAITPLAEQISKDLKKRGFTFVGPTIVYSFLQAIGMVNDHIVSCPCYERLTK